VYTCPNTRTDGRTENYLVGTPITLFDIVFYGYLVGTPITLFDIVFYGDFTHPTVWPFERIAATGSAG
jgi:hypothetical protein